MGEGDEPDESTQTKRGRSRVTLQFRALPLVLPGEEAPEVAERPSDPGLLLDPRSGVNPIPRFADPPPAPTELEDGWSRSRGSPSSAPPRPEEPLPNDDVEGEEGDALTLVAKRARRSSPGLDYISEMKDRFALGDYTTALELAELVLGRHPAHEEASAVAEGSREKLSQLYGSRLGELSQVVTVAVDAAEVRWLGLDSRAAFLLSRIDGASSLRDVISVSGMERVDALKTLVELMEMKAIQLAAC